MLIDSVRQLSASGVRNLEQFNAGVLTAGGAQDVPGVADAPLMPSIVIVIDELAELMEAAGEPVGDAIVRLAQMSRAVGIHLVAATNDLSVDVVTGLITANLPSRMAFRCALASNSRAIIDGNGAEQQSLPLFPETSE